MHIFDHQELHGPTTRALKPNLHRQCRNNYECNLRMCKVMTSAPMPNSLNPQCPVVVPVFLVPCAQTCNSCQKNNLGAGMSDALETSMCHICAREAHDPSERG